MYVDVDQLHAAHHDAAHFDRAEARLSQVAGAELRAAEIDLVEPGTPEILTHKVGHASTVTSHADDPPPHRHEWALPCHQGETEVAPCAARRFLDRDAGSRRIAMPRSSRKFRDPN